LTKIGLSFITLSAKGLSPIISNELPFNLGNNSLNSYLLRYSTPIGMMLGQGDKYFTGLYGPFPVQDDDSYQAMTYSFFIPDSNIGSPRKDLNLYTFAIIFIPKKLNLNNNKLVEVLDDHIKKMADISELRNKESFVGLVKKLESFFGLDSTILVSEISARNREHSFEFVTKKKEDIPLEVNGEDLIAIPWILHAVYHGMEKATYDLLGDSVLLHEELMERYTIDILDKFHLLDTFIGKETKITDAIKLGIKHLEKVGEKINLRVLSENKYEFSIDCTFAEAVHPHLPLSKCLWMRYLVSIIRRVLPPNKDLILSNSEFDTKGSVTIIEIKDRIFKTIS
jgi:hypothetical protein